MLFWVMRWGSWFWVWVDDDKGDLRFYLGYGLMMIKGICGHGFGYGLMMIKGICGHGFWGGLMMRLLG